MLIKDLKETCYVELHKRLLQCKSFRNSKKEQFEMITKNWKYAWIFQYLRSNRKDGANKNCIYRRRINLKTIVDKRIQCIFVWLQKDKPSFWKSLKRNERLNEALLISIKYRFYPYYFKVTFCMIKQSTLIQEKG